MALVWSKEKVALQIDDDPTSEPFCGPDDWTVIHVTTDQLGSFEGCQEVVDHLSRALGAGLSPDGDGCLPDADEMPWRLGAMGTLGLPWEVPVPSDDLEEALGGACFGALGDAGGDTLDDTGFGALGDAEADPSEDWPEERVDWDDRLPEGSVRIIRGRRMSTPEFLYLRRASQLGPSRLAQLGMELCGLYATDHLDDPRSYRVFGESVCTIRGLRAYLRGARGLAGYDQAMDSLAYVAEGSHSPMASYLFLLLTLPREMGGYGLDRPMIGVDYQLTETDAPDAPSTEGPYEAYDLCWPDKGVALQYVGETPPSWRDLRSLTVPGLLDLKVVCVTRSQVASVAAFDEAVRALCRHLGAEVPNETLDFIVARASLRDELEFPSYDHMCATARDAHCHELV